MRLPVQVCRCTANQSTEVTCTCFRFKTEERVLRVNKSKSTGQNTFNGDHFDIGDNHGSSKDEKILFWVFLQTCDQCFNLYTANYIYLHFSIIVSFYEFFSHLQ